ncbi:hypothetical protein ACFX15_003749 [Malus domestica]
MSQPSIGLLAAIQFAKPNSCKLRVGPCEASAISPITYKSKLAGLLQSWAKKKNGSLVCCNQSGPRPPSKMFSSFFFIVHADCWSNVRERDKKPRKKKGQPWRAAKEKKKN